MQKQETGLRKPIKGFEGYYEIDETGNVYTVKRKAKFRVIPERLKKHHHDKDGYLAVSLTVNNKSTTKKVHRLVAETYIPNPKNKPTVNHIDGDKTNPHVNNLEWATHKENQNHAVDTGLLDTRKSIIQYDLDGVHLAEFCSLTEAAKSINGKRQSIGMCANGRYKTSYGYKWEWKDEQ